MKHLDREGWGRGGSLNFVNDPTPLPPALLRFVFA